MRTLNKALCLVLAVVMCVGLLSVGANAAFDDADKITANYKEAVEVMTGIGVIDGKGGNLFDPAGTLTREQAAKIICYVVLGPTNAAKISAASVSTFADVAADRWSAGYIEYAANMKIVAGVGDGKFNPEGKLSTAAFAKMLLCAVGYDATKEGLEGASWAVNVAALATSKKLVETKDNITISASIDCSREQACQMAFNALFMQRMEAHYSRDNGEAYFTSYNEMNTCLAKDVFGYNGKSATTPAEYYGKYSSTADANSLARVDSAPNGITGYKWYYKSTTKPISGFYEAEKVIGTSTDGTDIMTLTNKSTINKKFIAEITAASVKVFVNGKAVNSAATMPTTGMTTGDYYFAQDTMGVNQASAADTSASILGNGVVIDFISTDTDMTDAEKIAITTYYVDVVKAAPVVKTMTDGKDYIYIDMVGFDIGAANSTTLLASNVSGYQGLAKDDVLMVVKMADGTYKLTKATPAQGTPTACTGASPDVTSLTIDGKVVKVAKNAALESAKMFAAFGYAHYYWVDANGYLVATKAVTAVSTNYLMVLDSADYSTSALTGDKNKSIVVFDDGTTATITVSAIDTATWASGNLKTAPADFAKYAYVKNDDGTYNLTTSGYTEDKVEGTPTANYSTSHALSTVDGDGTITAGVSATSKTEIKADAGTIFVYRDIDKSASPTSAKDGAGTDASTIKYKSTWSAVTGVANAKTVKTASFYAVIGSDGYASVIFVSNYVLTNAEDSNFLYILGKTPTVVYKGTAPDYYTYPAVVDGVASTVKAKAVISDITAGEAGLYKVTYTNGVLTAATKVVATNVDDGVMFGDKIKSAEGGLIKIKDTDFTYADKCVVYVISKAGVVTAATVDSCTYESGATVYGVATKGITAGGTAAQANNLAVIYIQLAY